MQIKQLVIDFINDNNITDEFPTHSIAKKLYAKYPEVFKDVENARTHVRYIRGNNGKKNREGNKNTDFFRKNGDVTKVGDTWHLTPIDISIKDFDYKYKKPLILSDIHLPYHDLDCVLIALEHGVKNGIDSIYLNGDILDCYRLSSFTKRPDRITFTEEREMFWSFIDFLNTQIGLPITFKMGNHEERWDTYLLKNSPEVYTLNEFALQKVLKLEELEIDFVSGRQKCNMGKLIVIHGHEFGESIFSPVNPARGLFLKAKANALCGHNHQSSEHHESNLKGDALACYSVGSLCQLTPEYRPFAYTKWNHGFAIVEIDPDDSFHVDNLRIVNGKVK